MKIDVIHQTDALSGLKLLDDNSVDCVVTSPPYWQLRDYGLEPVLFGGNAGCTHIFNEYDHCQQCGGWLGELGHEPTRGEFITHLLEIFDECRRVLKPSGTLWVNMGDSYSKPYKYNRRDNAKWGNGENTYSLSSMNVDLQEHKIRAKSLCNIPGMFAEGMIERGWILRNEIIWHKPSVIPASVRDRFTVDFEKLYFFVKSPKYYFDQQFEPYAPSTFGRYKRGHSDRSKAVIYNQLYGAPVGPKEINPKGRNKRAVWRISTQNNKYAHFASFPTELVRTPILAGSPPGSIVLDPFMGSGTTAIEARRLGRHYIGIEPNPEYVAMSNSRLKEYISNN